MRLWAVVLRRQPPPIAPDPGDQTDIADREIVQLQSDALLEHYRMQLSDIAAARARMDIGTYGICSTCQTPITFERLAAYPTATRCAQCQRMHECRYPRAYASS